MSQFRVQTAAVLALATGALLIGWVGTALLGPMVPDGAGVPEQACLSVTDVPAHGDERLPGSEKPVFTRTGRMDRQDIRYGGHRAPTIAEQDIERQAQLTQARMR